MLALVHKKNLSDVLRLGAENGARTRDLNLGKVALYQLSYFRDGNAKIDAFLKITKFSSKNLSASDEYGHIGNYRRFISQAVS